MNIKKNKAFIGICAIILIMIGIFNIPAATFDTSKIKSDDSVNIISHKTSPSASNLISLNSTIDIDASSTGLNAHNWVWAKSQGYCTGLGTQNNPYVIENFSINGNGDIYLVNITNSNNVYFVIRNNEIFNSSKNHFGIGIFLSNCSNGEIYGNILYDNYYGISVTWFSHHIWVHNNQLGKIGKQPNYANIDLDYFVNWSIISENKISGGVYGMDFEEYCENNTIANNVIYNQTNAGIFLGSTSQSNVVYGNLVYGCKYEGLFFGLTNNMAFDNCIAQNYINLVSLSGNYMNNSLGGNYWSDYSGSDANHDGFGDTKYMGDNSSSYDYLPLMNYPPIILEKPADVTYKENTSVSDLIWNAVDFSFSSLTYDIYVNGDLIQNDMFWYSGQNITVPISGLSAGNYQYKIVLNDGDSGSVSDIVSVTVIPNSNTINNSTETPTKSTLDSFLGILNQYSFVISAGIIAIAIIIYGIIKRPRNVKCITQKPAKSKNLDRE